MNLKLSIQQGKEKYAKAKETKLKKAILRPMTVRLFVNIFQTKFESEGYGIPALLTKKDIGMLRYLIDHLSLNMTSMGIAELAQNLVGRWKKDIAEHVFNTVEGKKLTMPTRPNLRAFLYCKNDIVSFLTGEEEVDDDGENPNIMPT